ncbi:molybdopterin molybdotransferase [Thermocatellispora tengchongensis]|uniref:Molybdopterin molybdenumtransferase n=1 Tax=Thermocatellispora tengchongensis TaxID=1073253 RepID=A0A840PEE8_9ACTN|nr:molybdopterin molybdotransferase MoeA [Thermocatellispora tengchongensis]MBB5137978.1 molybdopterin molybdotransferase [Thermocatellispora tengchongensis]
MTRNSIRGPARKGSRGAAADMPWAEARALAAAVAGPLPPAEVPLAEAGGLRLAAPVRALAPIPGFDTAAMDGYAVAGPPPWRVVGSVLAGRVAHEGVLAPGTAVEIATGAEVPHGADAVLPVEGALRTGDLVRGEIARGRHIRPRGTDCPQGRDLVTAGAVVTPALLGLAASVGHDTLTVHPPPRVAVLVTGDEVVSTGLPGRGRVRDAIGPMLPGLLSWSGARLVPAPLPDAAGLPGGDPGTAGSWPGRDADPPGRAPYAAGGGGAGRGGVAAGAEAPVVPWARVRDSVEALAAAVTAAGAAADVVVVCGASSKGPADHLRRVLADLGAEVLVAGVACRPGHPQVLARLPGGRVLVGLPGNPFAALVAAMTLLVPALRALGGRTPPGAQWSALAGDVRPHPALTRLVAVRRAEDAAVPVGHDRPGTLWGAALADALAVVPPGWGGAPVELVELPS